MTYAPPHGQATAAEDRYQRLPQMLYLPRGPAEDPPQVSADPRALAASVPLRVVFCTLHDLVAQVAHASGTASLHECNRFPLIIRGLADAFLREEKYQHENRAKPNVKRSHFYLRRSLVSLRIFDPYVKDDSKSM